MIDLLAAKVDPADVLAIVVYHGDPVSAPRPRFVRGGNVYVPGPYQSWRDGLAWAMTAARTKGRTFPFTGPVGVRVLFDRRTNRRADIDNFLKGVMDAGNGVIWADDVQVVEVLARKRHDPGDPKTCLAAYAVDPGAT